MELLTTKEFAEELGVTRQRVEQLIYTKEIDPKKVIEPKSRRIWGSEVKKLKIKQKLCQTK